MTNPPQHIGWQPKGPKRCPKCRQLYDPTGPRARYCLACNPRAVNCSECGERYLRHRAHRCAGKAATAC